MIEITDESDYGVLEKAVLEIGKECAALESALDQYEVAFGNLAPLGDGYKRFQEPLFDFITDIREERRAELLRINTILTKRHYGAASDFDEENATRSA